MRSITARAILQIPTISTLPMTTLVALLPALSWATVSTAEPTELPVGTVEGSTLVCRTASPELETGLYSGPCRNGSAHGEGLVRDAITGHVLYRGHFVAGRRAGQGHMLYPNGDTYTGTWHQDQRHGTGTYRFGRLSPWAGDEYQGQWQSNLFHGIGRYLWTTGDQYEGPWHLGQQGGPATSAQLRRQVYVSALVEALPRHGYQVCPITPRTPKPTSTATVHAVIEDRLLLQWPDSNVRQWQPAAHWRPCQQRSKN